MAIDVLAAVMKPHVAAKFPATNLGDWTATVTDMVVATADEEWTFESFEEALAEYRKGCIRASFRASGYPGIMTFEYFTHATNIGVSAPERGGVERVFAVFEEHLSDSVVPAVELQSRAQSPVTIFIGHGRDAAWRDLKDHLQDQHGLRTTAYETGVRAGQSIQDILSEMVEESSMALLVHTGEDVDSRGQLHARENVIHETGLFQGRLGLRRAIILREEGCNPFSNIAGVQELRFSRGNIREVFGEVVAIVHREFGDSI